MFNWLNWLNCQDCSFDYFVANWLGVEQESLLAECSYQNFNKEE
ncbi:MAG: hypothetical protein QNJ55_18100 [Xenococcus sp. MO_188.B8]|nr:hypothetical protein [Xenococcus sp. MO_188.B8]